MIELTAKAEWKNEDGSRYHDLRIVTAGRFECSPKVADWTVGTVIQQASDVFVWMCCGQSDAEETLAAAKAKVEKVLTGKVE